MGYYTIISKTKSMFLKKFLNSSTWHSILKFFCTKTLILALRPNSLWIVLQPVNSFSISLAHSSNKNKDLLLCPFLQERLSHGISSSGFPGNHRTSDFPPTYFPPPFPSQQPTPQEVFAAQNAHLDPYTNSLHSFQATQVRT